MTGVELLASGFLLACVVLSAIRNIWTWPTGIIGVCIFFYICYESALYADMWLQVVFLAQSIYGWYFWTNGTKSDVTEVPIRKLNQKESILSILSIVILTLLVGYVSETFSDTDVPYLDATVASISLIANILLARKIIDNWVLWIIADVMYIGLFYYKGLYVTSVLYVIFLIISSVGLIEWYKKWRIQEA